MIWLVRLYKKILSPILPNSCRFTPTCSSYAIEAFEKRGFFAGFILTVWRILRCNPFCKGGYDPVPEKGFRRVKCPEAQHTDSETAASKDNSEAQNATLPDREDSPEAIGAEPTPDFAEDSSAKQEVSAEQSTVGKDNFEA